MNRSTHSARPAKNAHSSNRSAGTYTPENTVLLNSVFKFASRESKGCPASNYNCSRTLSKNEAIRSTLKGSRISLHLGHETGMHTSA